MLESILGPVSDALILLADGFIQCVGNILDLDLTEFVTKYPILASGYSLFRTMAIGIVILLALYQIAMFFKPGNSAREAPTSILIRSFSATFMVYFGGHFLAMLVNLANHPYKAFLKLGAQNNDLYVTNVFTATIGSGLRNLVSLSAGTALVELILGLILLVMLFKGFFRLIAEILERYLLVGVLTFAAPLGFSTIASPATSQICSRYLNMYCGQLLLMSLSVWSYNLALSTLGAVNDTMGKVEFVMQILMCLAAFRLGQRMDTFLQQLGVGVGVTGGGMADEVMGVAMSVGRGLKKAAGGFGGGEDGTGHRNDSILGGSRDASGNVAPEPTGTGLLGAGITAVKSGIQAARQGGSASDIAEAVKGGAKSGFGFSDGDKSMFMGRRLNSFINSRSEARSAATTETAGGAVVSGDQKQAYLDPTAKGKGLKMGKNGDLDGSSPVNVGRFMAANMGKKNAQEMLQKTAQSGNPAFSEQALFGTHNNLKHDKDSEVSKDAFDQMGSDMTMATFGSGLQALETKAGEGTPLSQEEENLRDVGAVMAATMQGDKDSGRLANFQAHDKNGPDGGRELTADVHDKDGKTIGSVTALDEKGYKGLSADQKQGFVPIQSATGATYYMRASGVTVNGETTQYGKVTSISAPSVSTGSTSISGTAPAAGVVPGTGTPGATPAGVAAMGAMPGGGYVSGLAGSPTASPNIPEGKPFEHKDGGVVPAPAWKESSLAVSPDSQGKDIIKGEDDLTAGAAVNYALNSSRNDEQRLAHDTINSPDCDKFAVQQALFNPDAGGISMGHDQPVARMLDTAVGAEVVGGAVGGIKDQDGQAVISKEDASHFAQALHAASGTDTGEVGYSCDNFSAGGGVVGFDYHTPSGDFRMQMATQDTMAAIPSADGGSIPQANFNAGNAGEFSITAENITPTAAPAAEPPISAPAPTATTPENQQPIQAPSPAAAAVQPISASAVAPSPAPAPTAGFSAGKPMPPMPPAYDVVDPSDDDGRYGGRGKGKRGGRHRK